MMKTGRRNEDFDIYREFRPYIGNFGPIWSTENEIRRSFEYLGWSVIQLQENQTSTAEVRQADLSSDLLLITSTWDDALDLNEMITTFYLCSQEGHTDCDATCLYFRASANGSDLLIRASPA
jgi:hypothetical protein